MLVLSTAISPVLAVTFCLVVVTLLPCARKTQRGANPRQEPMIVTPASTVMEPETVDPDGGDVMVTTRLPAPWARAGADANQTQQEITDSTAARASLIVSLPPRCDVKTLKPCNDHLARDNAKGVTTSLQGQTISVFGRLGKLPGGDQTS